jgi:hypothetical protein
LAFPAESHKHRAEALALSAKDRSPAGLRAGDRHFHEFFYFISSTYEGRATQFP